MRISLTFGFLKALFIWVALCANITAEPLSPDEKANIEKQRADANLVSKNLEQRIACYADTDQMLQSESEKLQSRSGELNRSKTKLNNEMVKNKEQLKGFSNEYDRVKQEMEMIEQNVDALATSVAQKIATIEQCRRDAGIFAFTCDVFHELFGVSNQLRKQQRALKEIVRHKGTVKKYLQDARNRYDRSSTEYKNVLAQMESNQKSLSETNSKISDIKKTLENMRIQEQVYAKARNGFDNAIAEIEGKDLDTDRRYYQRKLREASKELAEKTESINQILAQQTQSLSDGRKICTR